MKKFVIVLSIIVVFTLSLNFLHAIAQDVRHQDVYYHWHFDHHGNLISVGDEEVLYAFEFHQKMS